MDLYESEKQRIIEMQEIKSNFNDNAGETKEDDGFTRIVLSQGGGYDQIFYYCDDQLKVKYWMWNLGW